MDEVFYVALVGIIGGVTNILAFQHGRFYPPQKYSDEEGMHFWDLGFIKEVLVGVVAAFIAILPAWEYVPVLYKLYTGLMASIVGTPFILSTSRVVMEKVAKKEKNIIMSQVKKSTKKDDENRQKIELTNEQYEQLKQYVKHLETAKSWSGMRYYRKKALSLIEAARKENNKVM